MVLFTVQGSRVIGADWVVCWLQHTQGQRVKGARTSQFGEIEIIKLIYISTNPPSSQVISDEFGLDVDVFGSLVVDWISK